MIGTRHPSVEIAGFSGPFDLLLRLIERRELDVLTVSLATVTEQYLAQLAALQLRDPEHLSAFLVVAAKLLYLKSTLLLPTPARPAPDSGAPADPTDLTERLREYQRFREAGRWLAGREDADLRSYPRPTVPLPFRRAKLSALLEPAILRQAMLRVLTRPKIEDVPAPLVLEPRLAVATALDLLRQALDRSATVRLGSLMPADAPRGHRVALFLAVLEAIRQGLVNATQDEPHGEITVTWREAAGPGRTRGSDPARGEE